MKHHELADYLYVIQDALKTRYRMLNWDDSRMVESNISYVRRLEAASKWVDEELRKLSDASPVGVFVIVQKPDSEFGENR